MCVKVIVKLFDTFHKNVFMISRVSWHKGWKKMRRTKSTVNEIDMSAPFAYDIYIYREHTFTQAKSRLTLVLCNIIWNWGEDEEDAMLFLIMCRAGGLVLRQVIRCLTHKTFLSRVDTASSHTATMLLTGAMRS